MPNEVGVRNGEAKGQTKGCLCGCFDEEDAK